jgi:2-oxoisovalerate dehydrogenase E1 component
MPKLNGYSKKDLLDIYKKMALARRLDEKQLIMLKQGKAFFHIGCSGHEASQMAAAQNMIPGKDWSYPYYRDAALCLGLGMTSKEQLLSFLAKADDPNSGGRQMPQHYGHKDLRIVSQSSPTGTQFLQAVGCAMSRKWENDHEIVYVSSGEGSTSEGEFHEALNWASREKLPIIFHIQDNEYAISVHVSEQTSGSSVFSMVNGYDNLSRYEVDGTNFFEADLAFREAIERARQGKGPSVIVSNVVRLLSHSSSDDQKKYRKKEDLDKDKNRDPLLVFEKNCIKNKILKEGDFEKLRNEIIQIVDQDAEWADKQNHPDPNSATNHIYSNEPNLNETPSNYKNEKIVLVDAINHAMHEEMKLNDKLIIYGEDIADPKGGVFTATRGLSDSFGDKRVFNSPLAEASIVGTAVGLATTGWKPCVEIQFGDYIWPAMMQIRNEVASMRYRSNGSWKCPMVIRVPVGGYIHGAICHSQSIDGYFMHMPGIRIAYPSNAEDAKGLLKAALRMDDPVLFLEHKGLYRQGFAASKEPDENYVLPFGVGKKIMEGDIVTVISWGAMVQKSIEAISMLKIDNGIIDLIDLRTLNPLDYEMIGESVKKTGKILIVHEDNKMNGPGAEISAHIAENYFDDLDAPIMRVASSDSHIPYNWHLEEKILVQTEDIQKALKELLEY